MSDEAMTEHGEPYEGSFEQAYHEDLASQERRLSAVGAEEQVQDAVCDKCHKRIDWVQGRWLHVPYGNGLPDGDCGPHMCNCLRDSGCPDASHELKCLLYRAECQPAPQSSEVALPELPPHAPFSNSETCVSWMLAQREDQLRTLQARIAELESQKQWVADESNKVFAEYEQRIAALEAADITKEHR